MKSINTILKLIKETYLESIKDDLTICGLCTIAKQLKDKNIISKKEVSLFLKHLQTTTLSNNEIGLKYYVIWNLYDTKSRVKWLNKNINNTNIKAVIIT